MVLIELLEHRLFAYQVPLVYWRLTGLIRGLSIAVEKTDPFQGLVFLILVILGKKRGHVLVCDHFWRRSGIQVLYRVMFLAR